MASKKFVNVDLKDGYWKRVYDNSNQILHKYYTNNLFIRHI